MLPLRHPVQHDLEEQLEMRAAVFESPRVCQLATVRDPELGTNEIRICMEGTGVCASDLPVWEGRPWFEYPIAPGRPGHEGWGKVEEVGEGVSSVRPGDRVAALSTSTYADYDVADAGTVVVLPESLQRRPFPGEPLACAMNAFKRCCIKTGDDVAVVGGGFQGLLLTQLAVDAGANVTLLSRRPWVLDVARAMGASAVVEMDDHERAIGAAKKHASDDGFSCVIEATGHQWPLDLAGELTRTRGRLVVVGYHQDPRQVNMQQWNWRGLDVINAHERDPQVYVSGLEEAIAAVAAGRLTPWPLFTHEYELGDLATALDTASRQPDGFVKALIRH